MRNMDEDKENILLESIKERLRKVRDNPAKVLLVPPLCAGYLLLLGGLYANMLVYHYNVYNKRKGR
tara:strand:- start:746 stop:943 length:198 start_codon:yes stop_codon:yes gene_type:complete